LKSFEVFNEFTKKLDLTLSHCSTSRFLSWIYKMAISNVGKGNQSKHIGGSPLMSLHV